MIDQLAKLSELAPDVCQLAKFGRYDIGEYQFGVHSGKVFYALCDGQIANSRPAFAWLRDAIEGEIERRGWTIESWPTGNVILWSLNDKRIVAESRAGNMVEALLATFLAAVEGEGR